MLSEETFLSKLGLLLRADMGVLNASGVLVDPDFLILLTRPSLRNGVLFAVGVFSSLIAVTCNNYNEKQKPSLIALLVCLVKFTKQIKEI